MSRTKITSASVRVSLSCNYNTFEVALNIENQDGLDPEEITEFRLKAQDMANEAVEDYKLTYQPESQVKPISKKDNISVAEIEKMPTWQELKQRQSDNKSKKS